MIGFLLGMRWKTLKSPSNGARSEKYAEGGRLTRKEWRWRALSTKLAWMCLECCFPLPNMITQNINIKI